MLRLNEWKAQDGSTIKLSSSSPTGSGTQQKFEDFTDLYLQLIGKIKKLWGCSVIRCESDILELKLAAGVFRRHLLIDYNSNQKTFTVTITDPTTRKQIESGTCYRGFISVLLLLMKNGIIKDTKLEESMNKSNKEELTNFAAEFELYENLFTLTEDKTGVPYRGYIICYGCYNTDRWYVKDSYENFLGTKSGYSTEEEAKEYIDKITK